MTSALLLGSIMVTAIGAVTFAYLYRQFGDRYLALWAAAFGLWVFRYVYGLTVGGLWTGSMDIVVPALALARGLLILAGTLQLTGRRLSRAWIVVVALDLAWMTANALGIDAGPYSSVPHYWLLAVMLIWAGGALLRAPALPSPERWVAGGGLVLMGLHQGDFPFLAPIDAFRPWGIVLQNGFMVLAIFGILLTYFAVNRQRLDAAHYTIEEALTRVIGDYVPICAHCKSIRDETGEWGPIEQYLTEETGAELTHAYCPTCIRTHYPGLAAEG